MSSPGSGSHADDPRIIFRQRRRRQRDHAELGVRQHGEVIRMNIMTMSDRRQIIISDREGNGRKERMYLDSAEISSATGDAVMTSLAEGIWMTYGYAEIGTSLAEAVTTPFEDRAGAEAATSPADGMAVVSSADDVAMASSDAESVTSSRGATTVVSVEAADATSAR